MKRSSGILKAEITCLLFASIILIEATTTHGETKFFMDMTCGIPDRYLVSLVPSECTSFPGIIEELINLYGGQVINKWNYNTSCLFYLQTNERDAHRMSEDIRVSGVSQERVIPITTPPPGWNCMDGIPITGFLESPIAGQDVSGMTTIHGWAFHPAGISKVELFIDNQFVGTIPCGSNRMDVKNAYPSYPMAENSGFSTIWDYSILSSGNHTTKVRLHAGEITKDLDVLVTDQGAYNFELMWGSLGTGNGQFNNPVGVAVDSSGNVYEVDTDNDCVQKFDSNGNFLTRWSSPSFSSSCYYPRSPAVDLLGNVYVVADETGILKFSSNGNFITAWNIPPNFLCLEGIAVDSLGNVYGTTYYCCFLSACPFPDQSSIWKFDSNGNLIAKWADWGAGDGQFDRPGGIAVDLSGNVYVADTGNHRIQKFDSTGTFISKWGIEGTGDGQFSAPYAVSVDSEGHVYVSDIGNDCIQKFDSTGNFITKWGYWGQAEGQFDNPGGIAVDSSGNVYVADTGNHRIQKFSPLGRETISTPNSPGGPAIGLIGTSYSYSTGGSSSTLGHFIEYRFDWGDGTTSNWSPSPTASKSWTSAGTYAVKAQARCAADISILSGWSPGMTVSISFITLQSPSNYAPYSPCSLDSPPVFSWNTGEAFKHYEIQFSGDGSFTSILAKMRVPTAATQVSIPLNTWKKALMISATSGEKVYWRVIGVRTGGATETSEIWSIVIERVQHVGNPVLSPTRKSSVPELSWQTNCNKKFKVVFGNDSTFTKKTTFTFNLKSPTQQEFSKALNPGQWMAIERLVKNVSGSTIYWYIESWDGLGRYAKTETMNFVLEE